MNCLLSVQLSSTRREEKAEDRQSQLLGSCRDMSSIFPSLLPSIYIIIFLRFHFGRVWSCLFWWYPSIAASESVCPVWSGCGGRWRTRGSGASINPRSRLSVHNLNSDSGHYYYLSHSHHDWSDARSVSLPPSIHIAILLTKPSHGSSPWQAHLLFLHSG